MDCENCRLSMLDLFDQEQDQSVSTQVLEHIQQCPECLQDYEQSKIVYSMLKPKLTPNAPFSLKQNVINQLKAEEETMDQQDSTTIRFSSRVKRIISIAAVFMAIMMLVPLAAKYHFGGNSTVKAADGFLESSIKASQLVKTMVIHMKVRTLPDDNFALIGTSYGMVDHTIWKSFESPNQWRVDKGKRQVVFDGQFQYQWIQESQRALKAGANCSFTEWLKILLDPENVLKKEQDAIKNKGLKFKMEEKGNDLLLSLESKAEGNFINDYCKNQSINESDNRREYVFDKNTKLLKALKIFVIEKDKEIMILELNKIEYNTKIDPSLFAIQLPAGIEWQEYAQNYKSERFKNISSKRAAELFFEALSNKDWALAGETCDYFNLNSEKVRNVKDGFAGLKVLHVGEPFKSGLFPGEFVPYEIKLKTGETRKHNLALRKDNENQVWVVDGGF